MLARWRGVYMMGGEPGNVRLRKENPACYEEIQALISGWRPFSSATPQPEDAEQLINTVLKKHRVKASCKVELTGGYAIVLVYYQK